METSPKNQGKRSVIPKVVETQWGEKAVNMVYLRSMILKAYAIREGVESVTGPNSSREEHYKVFDEMNEYLGLSCRGDHGTCAGTKDCPLTCERFLYRFNSVVVQSGLGRSWGEWTNVVPERKFSYANLAMGDYIFESFVIAMLDRYGTWPVLIQKFDGKYQKWNRITDDEKMRYDKKGREIISMPSFKTKNAMIL
jgi:hypothetical protein